MSKCLIISLAITFQLLAIIAGDSRKQVIPRIFFSYIL